MRTLFPMETNLLINKSAADHVANHINDILEGRQAFLPQTRVHAAKPDFHFRRTFKLDVANPPTTPYPVNRRARIVPHPMRLPP